MMGITIVFETTNFNTHPKKLEILGQINNQPIKIRAHQNNHPKYDKNKKDLPSAIISKNSKH